MKKKLLLTLCLATIITVLLAISVSSAEPVQAWDISQTSDDNVTAYLYADTQNSGMYTLSIGGTGNMKNWSSYSSVPWYSSYKSKITSAIIEEGVTSLGSYVFSYCTALRYVQIPDSAASIGNHAFYAATALTNVEIPIGVTTIGSHAFSQCYTLIIYAEASSKQSDWSTYWNYDRHTVVWGVKDKGVLENGAVWVRLSDDTVCIRSYINPAKSVVIPEEIDGYTVSSIGKYAFHKCSEMERVMIPKCVTSVGYYAFASESSLTVYAEAESEPKGWEGGWNISEYPVVWGHTHTYNNRVCLCGKNEGVEAWDISENDDGSVMAYLYNDTQNEGKHTLIITGNGKMKDWENGEAPWHDSYSYDITSVTIEEGVTTIGAYAFSGFKELKHFSVPDGIKSIGKGAFSSCWYLESVYISATVESIDFGAFAYCERLKMISVDEASNYFKVDNGVLYTKDGKILLHYIISKEERSFVVPSSVETILTAAFMYCENLSSVIIHNNVKFINIEAFDSLVGYPDMTIFCFAEAKPDTWDSSWRRSDAYTVVWGIDGYGVTEDGFEWVLKDGSIIISGYIGDNKNVIVPSVINGHSVTDIANAFGTSDITSIYIPASIVNVYYLAFVKNYNLSTIYCEAESKPSGWDSGWRNVDASVIWDCKNAIKNDIFTFKGYSFGPNGSMAVGYGINYEALSLYEELTGKTLKIGVAFASLELLGGQNPIDNQGNAITLDVGRIANRDLTDLDFTSYDFVINGITEDLTNYSLVIAAYINDGSVTKYVQQNGLSDNVSGITYNEALSTVTE